MQVIRRQAEAEVQPGPTADHPGKSAWMTYCAGLDRIAWILASAAPHHVESWALNHAQARRCVAEHREGDIERQDIPALHRAMKAPHRAVDEALARRMVARVSYLRGWLQEAFPGCPGEEIQHEIVHGRAPASVLALLAVRALPPMDRATAGNATAYVRGLLAQRREHPGRADRIMAKPNDSEDLMK